MDKAVSRYQAMTPEQKKIYLEKCKEYAKFKASTDPSYVEARKQSARKWRENNKKYKKDYYEKNKEKILAVNKTWSLTNKDKVKKIQKKYALNNSEQIKTTRKTSYAKHKQKRYKTFKVWLSKNPEKLKQYRKTHRLKVKANKNLLLRHGVSNAIRNNLRKAHTVKNSKSEYLLGCTLSFYKEYLQNLFEDWMSWENWGKHKDDGVRRWNIDHIIPLSHFYLADKEQQKKAFHYTNTRPLEAFKNLSEGNRRKTC